MRNSIVVLMGAVLMMGAANYTKAALVARWNLDGDGSDSADSHDGTIYGNPTTVTGQVGQALDFDGNDYIDVPHHADLTPPNAMTVTAWFKPNSFPGAWPTILKKTNDTEVSGYSMEIGGVSGDTAHVNFVVNSDSGNQAPANTTALY